MSFILYLHNEATTQVMEAKKNPEYALHEMRGIFTQIGIITSISLVLLAFNWEFKEDAVLNEKHLVTSQSDMLVPITEIPPPEPPKPKIMAREFIETAEPEMEIEEFEIVIDQAEVLEVTMDQDIDFSSLKEEKADEVYMIVEEMPSPVGGITSFYEYLAANLNYPATARRLGVEGKVFVKFVVDEKGFITNASVVKGIGSGCDEEALRVIKGAPRWNPGKQRGFPVKVQIVLPVHFKLVVQESI